MFLPNRKNSADTPSRLDRESIWAEESDRAEGWIDCDERERKQPREFLSRTTRFNSPTTIVPKAPKKAKNDSTKTGSCFNEPGLDGGREKG